MGKILNMVGKRFGRLVVIAEETARKHGEKCWVCKCDCGNVVGFILGSSLRNGRTKSCGCLRIERCTQNANYNYAKHKRLYSIWHGMKTRCYNENYKQFGDYGGRGITVCDEWKDDFQAFHDWSIANGYEEGLTIDRKDTNGNYEPSNCEWVTQKANNSHRRLRRNEHGQYASVER